MKRLIMILLLAFIFSAGCTSMQMISMEENINNGLKPILPENSPEEQRFEISIPVYKF